LQYARFDTEMPVRLDDIDMNNHVHTSRYIDYYLAARFDQMERCYKMPMDEFIKQGWTWFVKSMKIEFKRSLLITDRIVVRTWLDSFAGSDVLIRFQIFRKGNMKLAAEGEVMNTLITIASGRSTPIPDWVIQRYAQFLATPPDTGNEETAR
jgi:acyl-CoA thioester hydrolase